MARFDVFTEDELTQICTGLFSNIRSPHDSQELAVEASGVYNEKVKQREDKLPHCKECSQLLPGVKD